MKQDKSDHGAYVRRVHEGTQRYTQDLLSENERLRILIAALEVEKMNLLDKVQAGEDILRANDSLRSLVASLEAEGQRLQEHSLGLRAEVERHRKEQARLLGQLEIVRAESQRFSRRYSEVEQQNSNLANLYVASYRLHGTLNRKEVLDTIQEIIANLVGSEHMGVFVLDPAGTSLELVASFGIDKEAFAKIPASSGLIGSATRFGEVRILRPEENKEGLEADLTAVVPLVLDGRPYGAIAVFRLLPQKTGLEEVDREIFELLATQAATALYCTGLHARTTGSGE